MSNLSLSSLSKLALLAAAAVLSLPRASAANAPVAIPVLVIATYETGKDRGDTPGELQFWAERQDLGQEIRVPGVDHPLLTNGRGLYAMVSGTTSRCAVQIMALAADPRFDLTHTYFVLSGIGGGFPRVMSLASAVWVERVVDGNPAFEIDSREIPSRLAHRAGGHRRDEAGARARRTSTRCPPPGHPRTRREAWARSPSSSTLPRQVGLRAHEGRPIPDSEALRAFGRRFEGYPVAQQPPSVLMGDSIGSDRFFHGEIMARWAEDWDRIYTRGAGRLAISDCEDAGACIAFQRLAAMGRVDFNRLLILRTACNFTVPPTGVTAERSLFGETISDSSGVAYIPALEADYRVGSVVAQKLLDGWAEYRDRVP
jgi:purine nucleoside permease